MNINPNTVSPQFQNIDIRAAIDKAPYDLDELSILTDIPCVQLWQLRVGKAEVSKDQLSKLFGVVDLGDK